MPARRHHVKLTVIGEAANQLRHLPPKEPESVPLREAIERLCPEIKAALSSGYSLNDVVELLNSIDDVFTNLSVRTVRKYLDNDRAVGETSQSPSSGRQSRRSGTRPQSHASRTRSSTSSEQQESTGSSGLPSASAISSTLANCTPLEADTASETEKVTGAPVSPLGASTRLPPPSLSEQSRFQVAVSPSCQHEPKGNHNGASIENAAFWEAM